MKERKRNANGEEYCRIHVPKSNAAQMADEQQEKKSVASAKKTKNGRKKKWKASTAVLCLHKFFLFICLLLLLVAATATAVLRRISVLRHFGGYIANFALRQLFLLNEICSVTWLRSKATLEVWYVTETTTIYAMEVYRIASRRRRKIDWIYIRKLF